MPTLHLLGTGSAVTDPHRTTTKLALEDDGGVILIDCGGDVVQRALMAGLELPAVKGLIVTHEHPDHVGGFPLMMLRLKLDGRTAPLPVYGLPPALAQTRRVLDAFRTDTWDLPEILWTEVDSRPGATVLDSDAWEITGAPGVHSVPVIGLRCLHKPSGAVIAYSGDTEPSEEIIKMARGADILVHEATGAGRGHSSIAQAVGVAQAAKVPVLVLVHLGRGVEPENLAPFRSTGIEIILGDELDSFEL